MSFAERPLLEAAPSGMGADDVELLGAATALLDGVYRAGVHEVAAAMRLADGSIVRGVHVEAGASRASVCAEAAAVSAAVITGHPIVAVVGVLRRPQGTLHLIEPCGVCAELLADHAPQARVWVAEGEGVAAIAVASLLPHRRRRSARAVEGGGR